ncbi:MAG: ATP-dependent DNA helicase RecG [Spirochaetaceae bacterium]|nr:MAG: ATP-dependent DNA helicase RecG [Spirochaetaceae bacterium]
MLLVELEQSVQQIKRVGPATARAFARLGIVTERDLLLHLPRDYHDRTITRSISEARDGVECNTVAEVIAHDTIGWGRKKTLKVYIKDASASAALICFGRDFLATRLKPGVRIRLAAAFSYRYGELQSSSFEFEEVDSPPALFGRVLPVYPLSEGLTQSIVRSAVAHVLDTSARHIEDAIPQPLRRTRTLRSAQEALRAVHQPETREEAEQARRTLAYEELFLQQMRLLLRSPTRASRSRRPKLPDKLRERAVAALPFALTDDQKQVIVEIIADLNGPTVSARLLQGDVGSGKTLVAFLTALPVIEAGRQVALMAPTELLARQHANTAENMLGPLGIRVCLLTGSIPARARQPLLEAVADGSAQLVIGTHAVFSDATRFNDLGFIIVDEQHRFGVSQRAALVQKGRDADLLLMTATPIPRTLALAFYGDMETSTIRSLPPGRQAIRTHLARMSNEHKVYQTVRRELTSGRQAYFVYPLIDPSDRSEMKNAETMYDRLQREIFPDCSVTLIHSRVPEEEKRERMEQFVQGRTQVLAATSVIEVGVDVPNATCMVVEHAERFGLAALHQLRGRVGRGEHQSYAFFVYSDDLSEDAKARLRILHRTSDGFAVAEEDLRMRGPGDLIGVRQSGFFRLHAADLTRDADLLDTARQDARNLCDSDPTLASQPLLKRLVEIHDHMEARAV